ncbi:MAG: 5-formyltetrahydrofolate cyclo-ligase [Eubacteriales bacterium]
MSPVQKHVGSDARRSLIRPGPGVSQPGDTRAAAEKARLRPLCRARLKSFSGEERASAERCMLDALYRLPVFRQTPLICAYIPLPGEIDLFPVWRRADGLGKAVAFPCTEEGDPTMIFRRVPAFDPAQLVPGPFHTRQPGEACPALSETDFTGALILVPGLTFDDYGYRLGYGGGYYDRFLRDLARRGILTTTVGLIFEDCRAKELPREAHDIPVDYVISEGRVTVTHADHDQNRTRSML